MKRRHIKFATYLLDADHVQRHEVVEHLDGADNELGEEPALSVDELGAHGGGGALLEQLALLLHVLLVDLHAQLVDAVDGELGGLAEGLDDQSGVHALVDEGLALLEELAGEDDHRGGAVADLGVLGLGDVDQRLGGRVDDVEELHDGCAVVGDGGLALVVHHELVHAAGPEGGADGLDDGLTGVDVGHHLLDALGGLGALLEDHELGLHHLAEGVEKV